MKKVIGLITALLVCISLACPALAAEGDFVPSITYKPEPEIIPVVDENGREALGVIHDAEGEIMEYVESGCLIVAPLAHVWDEEKEVAPEIQERLTTVYEELNDNVKEISRELFGEQQKDEDLVVRDLFDVSWSSEEYAEMVQPEGVAFEITFDVGIAADTAVYVATYDEETGTWEPVVKTVNNGDGTVTCTFEHLCVIAFFTPETEEAAPSGMMPWILVFVLAAAALTGLLIAKNRKKAA